MIILIKNYLQVLLFIPIRENLLLNNFQCFDPGTVNPKTLNKIFDTIAQKNLLIMMRYYLLMTRNILVFMVCRNY